MSEVEANGICPFCGGEFEIGASACPSCDLPLLERDPAARVGTLTVAAEPRPEYAIGNLRRVAVAANQSEAEMVEGLLRSEGIPCIVRRSGGGDLPEFLAAGPRDILVPEGGLAAARDMLQLDSVDPMLPAPSPIALAAALIAGLAFVIVCVAAIVAVT